MVDPAIDDDHVRNVCRIGQGEATCRYLTVGGSDPGFHCEKGGALEQEIAVRISDGRYSSVGDNCPGWSDYVEVRVGGVDGEPIGRLRPDAPMTLGSMSSLGDDGQRDVYLFGWDDGVPGVWRSEGGVDVEKADLRMITTTRFDPVVVWDLAGSWWCDEHDAEIPAKWKDCRIAVGQAVGGFVTKIEECSPRRVDPLPFTLEDVRTPNSPAALAIGFVLVKGAGS